MNNSTEDNKDGECWESERESYMSLMLDMRKNKSLVKPRSLRVNTHEQWEEKGSGVQIFFYFSSISQLLGSSLVLHLWNNLYDIHITKFFSQSSAGDFACSTGELEIGSESWSLHPKAGDWADIYDTCQTPNYN